LGKKLAINRSNASYLVNLDEEKKTKTPNLQIDYVV
jgi:hypothetical protein